MAAATAGFDSSQKQCSISQTHPVHIYSFTSSPPLVYPIPSNPSCLYITHPSPPSAPSACHIYTTTNQKKMTNQNKIGIYNISSLQMRRRHNIQPTSRPPSNRMSRNSVKTALTEWVASLIEARSLPYIQPDPLPLT